MHVCRRWRNIVFGSPLRRVIGTRRYFTVGETDKQTDLREKWAVAFFPSTITLFHS
ncbi:hypothetical protein BJV77DRAFT_1003700, partial [Russula vinacea]